MTTLFFELQFINRKTRVLRAINILHATYLTNSRFALIETKVYNALIFLIAAIIEMKTSSFVELIYRMGQTSVVIFNCFLKYNICKLIIKYSFLCHLVLLPIKYD